jgi:membrane protease YdiL (CAAX protease family)
MLGFGYAIAIQSILFVSMHLIDQGISIKSMLVPGLVGLLGGFIYERTGSIIVVTYFHSIVNTVVILLVF